MTMNPAPDGNLSQALTYHDDLGLVRRELDRCMRCGNCMAVCPVYAIDRVESAVARSRIAVAEAVLDGELSLDDPQVYRMVFNCLICRSCMTNCPTGVRFDRIAMALRAALVRKNGLLWLKRMIFATLRHPALFNAGMKAGAAGQWLVFRRDGTGKTVFPRSPFAFLGERAGFDAGRALPGLAPAPLREGIPEVVGVARPVLKVAFFTGDSLNYFYPDAGQDLIEVLTENGVEVHIPAGQRCCGMPVLAHGDVATARSLARSNIDVFERAGCDHVVTGCGSCGGAWKHDYPELLAHDPLYGPKARHWAERVYDISTFLTGVIGFRQPKGEVRSVVTYHDSCHLKKSMQVSAEPREILRAIPGVTFREMEAPDSCCGSGGSYMLSHYGTASAIGAKKSGNIVESGADTVTTGCPACMMQLRDGLVRSGSAVRVRHFISLLAESYRNERGGTIMDKE